MEQYQIVLTLGIVLILLIMIDIYRRIRRRRYEQLQSLESSIDQTNEASEKPEKLDAKDSSLTGTLNISVQNDQTPEDTSDVDDETVKVETTELNIEENITDPELTTQEPSQQSWESALQAAREKRFRQTKNEEIEPQNVEIQETIDLEEHGNHAMHRHSAQSEDSEENYLVFHIIAPRGYVFYGEDLNTIFNLRHYHLSVHNTYEYFSPDAELLFTVINLEEPKTFAQINAIVTPGVTLYCNINHLKEPYSIFRDLLSEAHQLAESLGGTLTNEQQRRFTQADFSRYMAKVKQAQNSRSSQSN